MPSNVATCSYRESLWANSVSIDLVHSTRPATLAGLEAGSHAETVESQPSDASFSACWPIQEQTALSLQARTGRQLLMQLELATHVVLS